ncbi:ATP-binding protein [Streptomyces sp. NBC_00271]|uniref:ATP-binding protein n=1 Tax=Streptomyces sp. NBC_00271 TaxID=2975697 RepID=UPI002E296C64|nr:AAA family ATPase [Streptomyces sp. NBC_00271]
MEPAYLPPTVIGRDAELRVLTDLAEHVAERGGAAAIVGEAGIGKSTLLAAAARHARGQGLQILQAVGVESESLVPFAGLHQLLRPVLGAAEGLPSPQHRALMSAFGVQEGLPPEPTLIALATLNLLTDVAAERPLLVAVDDVQWLDQPTHDAIAFLARRISRDPIVVLGAIRKGHTGPFITSGLLELEVQGLDDASACEVLSVHADNLSPSDRDRILRAARGNPLALVELPVAWRRTSDTGAHPSPSFMPLTARLEAAFAGRISQLAPSTSAAVLVAAVDSGGEVSHVIAAASVLTGHEVSIGDLEAAAEAGLLRFDEMRIRFRHPLVRSAVLQSHGATRRQAAHAALATVLADEPYRRTWHRAQAIVGPDDEIADELETSHEIALHRGSPISAIWALERSAQLTAEPARRGRRLLLAAEQAFGLGRPDMVQRLLDAAAHSPLSDLDQARMEWLREIFNDGVPGDAARVTQLCGSARQAAAADDCDLALNLLLGAALRCWWADTGQAARALVVKTAEELANVREDPRHVATLAVAEPVLCGRVVMERLSGVVLESVTDADALRLFGMAAHAVGDQVRAADFLDRSETRLRDQGRLGLLPHVLGMQCPVRLDLGDWERVAAASEEAGRIALETGQSMWGIGQLVNYGRAAGLRGDVEQALALASQAEVSPVLRNLNDFLACAQLARGYAWISAGGFGDAYEALERLFDPLEPCYHQRERFSGLMFLAEAAVHADRRDDARRILAEMEDVALITPSPLLHVQLLYARAVLAEDGEAEDLFLSALRADLTRWPWVKARVQLAFGSWLRRRRRALESREPLRNARTVFDLMGARAWAEQARIELRAAGERAPTRVRSVQDVLSTQELQIARLAADGLSNREIAQRLFLSPRTVGSHLYRIFPKLNITSRGQLASSLTGEVEDVSPVE